jgi:hypothetical protein
MDSQNEIAQQQIQAQRDVKQQEMDLKKYEVDSNNETKIQVAEIQVFSRQQDLDLNDNNIPDPIEVGKLSLEERRADSELFEKEQERKFKQKDSQDTKSLKEKELSLKEKEISSKEKIEKLKAETALKIAKANKNKFDKK